MIEGGDSPARSAPINEQDVISAEEIESDVRQRVQRLTGEELVQSLTSYMILTVLEVELQRDPSPRSLRILGEERIRRIKELAKAIDP